MTAWADAVAAARIFAVDPVGTGVVLRAPAGPLRDRWLAELHAALPEATGLRRVPATIPDDRLLGGVDLAATLAAGRPVHARGLLAEAEAAGGVLLLAMAERLTPATAARLADAAVGMVALDEGVDDERPPGGLADRLAFCLVLDEPGAADDAAVDTLQARAALPDVTAGEAVIEALCITAAALGIASMRAPIAALRVARAAAALAGRTGIADEDVALAARLVLAPRATRLPDMAAPEAEPETDQPSETDGHREPDTDTTQSDKPLEDKVLEAAKAAIPAGLLAQLQDQVSRARARKAGQAGMFQRAGQRGRPAGVRPGDPRRGLRLNLLETLRAAAPWQTIRRATLPPPLEGEGRGEGCPTHDTSTQPPLPQGEGSDRTRPRIAIRPSDFRITHLRQRSETTTIFVVDASGSAALARLAEAKGAVELLLAECYVRRDQVAVLAFRGRTAQMLLPPTRSLVRAKRALAGLPGGGGTPLAAGIDAGSALAADVRRRGGTPTLVLLTDGRANVARDGKGNRARAEEEALSAARRLRETGLRVLLVDTSVRPHAPNAHLARQMGARYLPLPYADAASLSRIVQANR